MSDPSLSAEQIVKSLGEGPSRIAALTRGLSPAQMRAVPAPDSWSVSDVLAHLRACSDVWGKSIAKILAEDNSSIRHQSPRTWIRKTNYLDLEFQPSLRALTVQRSDLIKVLKPLTPKQWARAAKVLKSGKVREQSVLFYANMLANHEAGHIEQIAGIVDELHK